MARVLNAEILSILRKKTGRKEKTIRNDISLLRRKYSSLPINSIAQIYATQNDTSVITKLTWEERNAIPNLDIQKPIIIRQKQPNSYKKKSIKQFLKYYTTNSFIKGHVDEVNRCYTFGCYTAAFILCRKIIENLLIDIIRKKYSQKKQDNLELYFDIYRGRTRDFSEIISKLRSRVNDFVPDKTLLERILSKSVVFKDDANNKAHSWYHLVKRSELENTDTQDIVEMLCELEAKTLNSNQ